MPGEGSAEKYSIFNALQVMRASLVTLAFAERYGLPWSRVVSVIVRPDQQLEIMLDEETFIALREQFAVDIPAGVIFNPAISSLIIQDPQQSLAALSGQAIFTKFPFYSEILDSSNYSATDLTIEKSVLKRCMQMARMWEEWGKDEGVPHLLSSLQALFRQVAAKMENPFVLSLPAVIENGLSVEYQCEIYADQLYGAKLLDIWNHYLLSADIKNRDLEKFKLWLRDYPNAELVKNFGINKEKIPVVTYMRDQNLRKLWKLKINATSISGDHLPQPGCEPMEIIYVLGREGTCVNFYGGVKERGTINHSSFFAGQKVEGAGRMILVPAQAADGSKSWKISYIDNNSGHIKPDKAMSINVLLALKDAGVNLEEISWRTKWGAPGLRDETAQQALQRMQKKFQIIDDEDELDAPSSLLVQKMIALAKRENLRDFCHFYLAVRHKITASEALSVAKTVLSKLETTLNSGLTSEERVVLVKLADQVLKLMHHSGKCMLSIMERVHKVKSKVMMLERNAAEQHKLFHGVNDRNFVSDITDEHTPDFSG